MRRAARRRGCTLANARPSRTDAAAALPAPPDRRARVFPDRPDGGTRLTSTRTGAKTPWLHVSDSPGGLVGRIVGRIVRRHNRPDNVWTLAPLAIGDGEECSKSGAAPAPRSGSPPDRPHPAHCRRRSFPDHAGRRDALALRSHRASSRTPHAERPSTRCRSRTISSTRRSPSTASTYSAQSERLELRRKAQRGLGDHNPGRRTGVQIHFGPKRSRI